MLIKFNRARLVRIRDTIFVESSIGTLREVMKRNPNIMFYQGKSDNSNTIILKTNINPSSIELYNDKTLYFAAYAPFDWLSFISSHKDADEDKTKREEAAREARGGFMLIRFNSARLVRFEDTVEAAREAIRRYQETPRIKNVIYNDPATIVFWTDGSKTVVKCGERDTYDPEKGLAMCIVKKFYGNEGNYYHKFSHWLPDEYK